MTYGQETVKTFEGGPELTWITCTICLSKRQAESQRTESNHLRRAKPSGFPIVNCRMSVAEQSVGSWNKNTEGLQHVRNRRCCSCLGLGASKACNVRLEEVFTCPCLAHVLRSHCVCLIHRLIGTRCLDAYANDLQRRCPCLKVSMNRGQENLECKERHLR